MSDFDLKKFDFEHWWKMLSAAGAGISIAAAATKFPAALFIGLGLLSIGAGEWINHPHMEEIFFPYKKVGNPRSNSIVGLILDIGGVALCVVGIYKLSAV